MRQSVFSFGRYKECSEIASRAVPLVRLRLQKAKATSGGCGCPPTLTPFRRRESFIKMADPSLAQLPLPLEVPSCTDEPDWTNGRGQTCKEYAQKFCVDGKLAKEFAWLGGEFFKTPESSCCACGRTSHASPPPPPAADMSVHGYFLHSHQYCRGADREVKKTSMGSCEEHCASRKCACAHFSNGMCRFTFTYVGLLRSHEGFDAFVRPGAQADPGAIAAKTREEAAAKTPAEACGAPPPRRVTPTFYMYDGPEFMWGDRLTRCYLEKNGRTPWAMPVSIRYNASYTETGPAPSADLSHSLWLHASLAAHRHRLREPEHAALFVVPAFGSLSEATGTCEGTTHLQRLATAAAAVRASPWFGKAATRHVVYAAAHADDLTPLGTLGEVLSKAGVPLLRSLHAHSPLRSLVHPASPAICALPLVSVHTYIHTCTHTHECTCALPSRECAYIHTYMHAYS